MDDILEQYSLAIKNIKLLDRNNVLGNYQISIYVWDELIADTIVGDKRLSEVQVDLFVKAGKWLFKQKKKVR